MGQIYKENNMGPRTEPCGTPESSRFEFELDWPIWTANMDSFTMVGQIRLEPGKSHTRNAKTTVKSGSQENVIYGIKSCAQIKRNQESQLAAVCLFSI